jgi:hypothetical protein
VESTPSRSTHFTSMSVLMCWKRILPPWAERTAWPAAGSRWAQRRYEDAMGEPPGWIFKHRAAKAAPYEIRVWQGKLVTRTGYQESCDDNLDSFVLDLDNRLWRRETPARQV